MLNEDKIKLMTSIAMFEKHEGRYIFPVNRYFKSDYISRNLLKALIGYTFCWVMGLSLAFIYYAEDIFSMFNFDAFRENLTGFVAAYVVGLVIYLIITAVVYSKRYEYGVQGMRVYVTKLRRLEKRYEFQNRTRELKQEGRRHDRNLGA